MKVDERAVAHLQRAMSYLELELGNRQHKAQLHFGGKRPATSDHGHESKRSRGNLNSQLGDEEQCSTNGGYGDAQDDIILRDSHYVKQNGQNCGFVTLHNYLNLMGQDVPKKMFIPMSSSPILDSWKKMGGYERGLGGVSGVESLSAFMMIRFLPENLASLPWCTLCVLKSQENFPKRPTYESFGAWRKTQEQELIKYNPGDEFYVLRQRKIQEKLTKCLRQGTPVILSIGLGGQLGQGHTVIPISMSTGEKGCVVRVLDTDSPKGVRLMSLAYLLKVARRMVWFE